jgi:hypothetical protein
MIAACIPLPHILLTVVAVTLSGSRRGLAESRWQDAAHDDLIDLPAVDPGARDSGSHRRRA